MKVRVARTCDALNPGTGPGKCCAALSAEFWKFQIEAGTFRGGEEVNFFSGFDSLL